MQYSIFDQITEIIQSTSDARPLLVGIDGVDGAGKSHFAARLADRLAALARPVIQSSVDYFHNPRAIRYAAEKELHVSFFENSFNYDALKIKLLDPLVSNQGGFVYLRHFDHRVDAEVLVEPTRIDRRCILVFDGIFLHRPELKDYWDFSIFLDVPFEETYTRMSQRDGCTPKPDDPQNSRYFIGQQLYLAQDKPKESATLVIDNANWLNPRILHRRK